MLEAVLTEARGANSAQFFDREEEPSNAAAGGRERSRSREANGN